MRGNWYYLQLSCKFILVSSSNFRPVNSGRCVPVLYLHISVADPDLDFLDPDLYNKGRIRIRMERYKSGSGSRTNTVNVQKQAMANY